MGRNQGLIGLVLVAMAIGQTQAADPPAAADAEKQVPLKIDLPRPLFINPAIPMKKLGK